MFKFEMKRARSDQEGSLHAAAANETSELVLSLARDRSREKAQRVETAAPIGRCKWDERAALLAAPKALQLMIRSDRLYSLRMVAPKKTSEQHGSLG